MPEHTTDDDLELLGELGVDTAAEASGERSAREQRIIAGFEEIERFVREHGRPPQHGENRDIFERLFAVRLDRMRESAECREILKAVDARGLLGAEDPAATTSPRISPTTKNYSRRWESKRQLRTMSPSLSMSVREMKSKLRKKSRSGVPARTSTYSNLSSKKYSES